MHCPKFYLCCLISLWFRIFTINICAAADNPAFVARHRLTSVEYQTLFNSLVQQSYRLLYVTGYVLNGQERFAAYFEKSSGPPQICRHGLTSAQYQDAFNNATAKGYRLILVNGYTAPGDVDKYVAIWDKPAVAVAPWIAKHRLTAAQYQTEFNNRIAQGFRLKHVSGYSMNNAARYAAIFEKPASTPNWVARHGLSSAKYQNEFNTQKNLGFVLVLICGYSVNNVDYYAAIFEKKASNPFIARHGMTSDAYQGEWTNNHYQGYRLKVISGYTKNNDDRYAAIWENPNMNGNDLTLINNQIQAYMNTYSIPGLSIAITDRERLVFAKGFGYADIDTNEKADPNNLFRIASVTKPMTSVAIMKLIEQKKFYINSKVFGASGLLGTIYGTKPYGQRLLNITVQHLLEHTSGFTNDGGDPIYMNYHLNQTEMITWVLDNRSPKYNPGTNETYFNFGYVLLGRIIEKISGQTYELYLRNNIFIHAPQTSRMVIGGDTLAEKKPNEVTHYPLSGAYNFRLRRADASGGWIARPIDLVGIMAKVDGFNYKTDILNNGTITLMWTPSLVKSGYGKGWILTNSYKGHNGAREGNIAFLVRRNDRLSFAVATNFRPANDSGAFKLKGVLDTIVTSVVWPAYDLF